VRNTVIGVVGDAVFRSLRDEGRPTLYAPLAQWNFQFPLPAIFSISVRSSAESPVPLPPSVVAALTAVDRDLVFTFSPHLLADHGNASLTHERIVATLAGFFAALALLLPGRRPRRCQRPGNPDRDRDRRAYGHWRGRASTVSAFSSDSAVEAFSSDSAVEMTRPWRQLTWTLADRPEPLRFLIRDRDQKFTSSFDEVFRSEGIESVQTPYRAPQANGVAERCPPCQDR
jgi:hypothetical protein